MRAGGILASNSRRRTSDVMNRRGSNSAAEGLDATEYGREAMEVRSPFLHFKFSLFTSLHRRLPDA